MATIHKKNTRNEAGLLFLGDIIALALSLWLTLVIRYGTVPSLEMLKVHFGPFSILFIASIFIYYVAGLYEKHTSLLKQRIPQTLINVQIVNAVLAIALFYFIPYFSIAPRIFLVIYLAVSLVISTWWRMKSLSLFESRKTEPVLLLTKSSIANAFNKDIEDLTKEINGNNRYGIRLIKENSGEIDTVVSDLDHTSISTLNSPLADLIFSGVKFIDIRHLYENIFDRIPLSLIDDNWCLKNISSTRKLGFDIAKRTLDISVSFILGIISLIFYPLVWILIKLDDGGVIFSYQVRVGKYGKHVKIMKFRTMSIANDDGKWNGVGEKPVNKITRVGGFLRKSRIDELPQLWNVLKGEISLIGPRPEFPDPVKTYTEQIPYYNLRHAVKPGLSGWAQIYHENPPHHGLGMEETANKLSYDLFYLKNRSFFLDLKIALRTLKVLITFAGK